jgi:serine/threonine protein kinase/predicted Rdx family selenoprotein
MNDDPEPSTAENPTSRNRAIDRLCDEFEAQWKAGASPQLEDFLARAAPPGQPTLLGQLLALELTYLAERGVHPEAGDYHSRFAGQSEAVAAAFERVRATAPANAPQLQPTESYKSVVELGSVVAGRYKLLEMLGEGGMGSVYIAEQEQPVQRRVALKLIKPGMDSRRVLRRFDAERQALAMMDHTHIAKVLDAGTTSEGRPFFVMELVKGVPITKYCDEHHLSLRDRLELFVPICRAIQHAHQKGIVHRDIKPSNVLVAVQDGKPVPKVIDFGVAKALHQKLTEGSVYTEIGQVVGTLEYMSPEQAELSALDIDTRTDVYALGVLLYELLTGTTPLNRRELKQAAYDEMLRMIREVEPPKPSTRLSESKDSLASLAAQRRTEPTRLTKAVRGELDWVVMKALEKDRTRRYETANGLARDIERHLNDEPVEACPPSATYRLGKLVRKHKGTASAAALLLFTLVGGIAGTTWGLLRAKTALEAEAAQRSLAVSNEQKALAAAEKEHQALLREAEQRQLADQRKELAETNERTAIAKQQIAKAVLNFLERDLLRQADASEQADASRRLGGAFEATENPTIRELLERAALELTPESIEARFPGQQEVQASILHTVAGAFRAIGDYDRALEFAVRASDSYREARGADHPDTVTALINLASAYQSAGRLSQAIDLLERLRERLVDPSGTAHALHLDCLDALVWAYQAAGRFSEAIELSQQVRDAKSNERGAEHPDTLRSMNNLAYSCRRAGRYAEAIELFQQVSDAEMKQLGPDHPHALTARSNLADVYRVAGEPALAAELLEQVHASEAKRLGADHPSALITTGNLAEAYRAMGDLPRATQMHERVRDAMVRKLGPEHPFSLVALKNVASAYVDAHRLPEAIALYEQVRAGQLKKLGAGHPEILVTLNGLGLAYVDSGKLAEAIELFEQVRKGDERLLGVDHPDTLTVLDNLASAYQQAGRVPEAIELFEQVRQARTRRLGPEHRDTLTTLNNLAGAYRTVGRLDEAIELIEWMRQAFVKKFGPEHRDSLTVAFNLATLYEQVGKLPQATELFEQVREARTRILGPDDPYTLSSLTALGNVYYATQKQQQALPLYREAALGFEKLNHQHPYAQKAVGNLIAALEHSDRYDEAEPWRRKWLAVVQARAGTEHPAYASELAALGLNLLTQKKWSEAQPVLAECLALREKLASNAKPVVPAWQVANVKSMLGEALAGQKRYSEAEPLLLAGRAGLKEHEAEMPPEAKVRVREALLRLIGLYEAWDKPQEAAQWRTELDATDRPAEEGEE